MSAVIYWHGTAIPFRPGETVAVALHRAGIGSFGHGPGGQSRGIFCGIGQCQGCLVRLGDRLTEACLLPCRPGLELGPDDGDAA